MTKVCLLLDDSREHVDGSASSDCDLESADSMVNALWKEIYADEAGCAPTKKGSTISRGSARISTYVVPTHGFTTDIRTM